MIRRRDRRGCDIRKEFRVRLSNNKIQSMMITVGREVNMLCKISRIECRKKLFSMRMRWNVKMNIKISSDKKFMWSSGCNGEKRIKFCKKLRKGTDRRDLTVDEGGGLTGLLCYRWS